METPHDERCPNPPGDSSRRTKNLRKGQETEGGKQSEERRATPEIRTWRRMEGVIMYRRTRIGDAFLSAGAAQIWSHDAFVSKLVNMKKGWRHHVIRGVRLKRMELSGRGVRVTGRVVRRSSRQRRRVARSYRHGLQRGNEGQEALEEDRIKMFIFLGG